MRTIAIVLLVVLASSADAQRGRGHDGVAQRGDLALTFTAEDVWGGFDNGGVGLRTWLGDRLVGAASVGVSFERQDSEFGPDTERTEAAASFGLEAHVGGSRTVSPFVGGGIRLAYARLDGRSTYFAYPSDAFCHTFAPCANSGLDADEVSVGAGIDLGAEIRLARGVTLLGAHRLGATFVSGDVEPGWVYYAADPEPCPVSGCEYTAPVTSDYTRWRIGTGETRVALSVYL